MAFWADIHLAGRKVGHASQRGVDDCEVHFQDPVTRVAVEEFVEKLPAVMDIGPMTLSLYFELLAHRHYEWQRRGEVGPIPTIQNAQDYY